MLDPAFIREHEDVVRRGATIKGCPEGVIDDFLAADKAWRDTTATLDAVRSEHKAASAKRAKTGESAARKKKLQDLETRQRSEAERREECLRRIPNIPFDDVPVGKSDEDNRIVEERGTKPSFPFTPLDHVTLGKRLDLLDLDRAATHAGRGFVYLKREAVLLEFAIVQYLLRKLTAKGFIPVVPPVLVRPDVMVGMGKAKFLADDDAYFLQKDELYLVGSAEHSVGPYHAGETLKEEDLPRRYVAFSTCFRRESGSYGKDTKGLIRVHQFDKVEMFAFSSPERSEEELRLFLAMQQEFLDDLKLPYRVVEVCTGEMTFGDARQFDIETWMPGEARFRETHSCSNTTDYQARGVRTKVRLKNGSTVFAHMLNGTACAIGRVLVAIMENYQEKDGSIRVPDALQALAGVKHIRR